ncbi:membrane protein [Skermanella stibiiresistens SB22]|uniref:Membrane protein n=1 Tax=Skermanella stibiiresistens SB22 TaxID=1385369 RepID=W9GQY4_9PROT|nr:YkvA family protein [Skermanella stibiiresistens]EWY36305.1 membrane protein [Skermanella stibiiresistens SB22]
MPRRIKEWARVIRRDVHALWLAARDPRTPWYAKVFALAIAAYALSPIDLIPDFIPVVGYLDEVILLPLAIMVATRLVPPDLMAEHLAAAARAEGRPMSRAGMVFIVTVWLLAAGALIWWLWPRVAR